MDFRFKLTAVSFLVVVMVLSSVQDDLMQGFVGVFITLGALLVFAVIALFPSLNRGDLADRSKAGGDWSDNIEFDSPPPEKSGSEGWR